MMFLKKPYLILLPVILIIVLSAFMLPGTIHQKIYQKADCPVIDYSHRVIKQPSCNQSNGSITGIIVTSTSSKITYIWHDADGNVVGHSLDLINIPAGTYSLEVTDNSGCTALTFTPPFEVDDLNAITVDDSKVSVYNSTCKNDGSITGITAVNATTYTWLDLTANTTVSTSSTTADISNLAPGSYQLTVSNNSCEVVKTYFVNSTILLPKIVSFKIADAPCGDYGSISINLNVSPKQSKLLSSLQDPTGYHEYDGIITPDVPNPTLIVNKLLPGTYSFYVQDPSGCVVLLANYTVGGGKLDFSNPTIENDRCDQQMGSITPNITGYQAQKGDSIIWTDAKTGAIVSRARTLSHVGAGTYTITILTVGGCRGSATYTITNASPPLIPPVAQGSTICLPGMINITVTNADTSKLFRLYDSPTSANPIDSSKNGIFYLKITETTDFYVTRVSNECESDRTKVTETVVASIKIPNAFTPNGDGINDSWNIAGIDKFPGADVKVFTRNGQLIYHSVNYAIPFNGTYNGSLLPPGVYYYIIDVKQPICFGKISGSLTIIR